MKMAKILWFTGLSGSGKTTICDLLAKHFQTKGIAFKILDGDFIRENFHKHLGFSIKDITQNNALVIELCRKYLSDFEYLMVSLISPLKEPRQKAREIFGENFIEIYLNCSYEECKKRDTKGLYKKAEEGNLQNFIGLHIPYEVPEKPELVLNTSIESPESSYKKIMTYLNLIGN